MVDHAPEAELFSLLPWINRTVFHSYSGRRSEAEMNDRLEPRIRNLLGSSIAIGPGKATLLEGISETGSIAAAGRRMGMSYRHAWLLAKTMNARFREPLIDAAKGGVGGGGARLTA